MNIVTLGRTALLLLLFGSAALARAEEKPRLYLSWHAPYGAPGATDTIGGGAGDAGRDTLFLTYQTRNDWPRFLGVVNTLYFRAAVGDTLDPFWKDERNVEVTFVTDSIPGYPRAWRGSQTLRFLYWSSVRGSASLKLSNTRPPDSPVAASKDALYPMARILFERPPAGVRRQPICIEWADAEFLPDSAGVTLSVRAGQEGRPFVSMNSGGSAVCDAYRPMEAKPAAAQKASRTKKKGGRK